jgi:hypothetical protein
MRPALLVASGLAANKKPRRTDAETVGGARPRVNGGASRRGEPTLVIVQQSAGCKEMASLHPGERLILETVAAKGPGSRRPARLANTSGETTSRRRAVPNLLLEEALP